MADLPLDKAYLTAIWLETLFYGACTSVMTCSEREHNPAPLVRPRHQLYALLDLLLRSHQEKEQDFVGHAGCGHLPVDAFHRSCVARLYRTRTLQPLHGESSLVSPQRLIYGFIYERDQPGGPAAYFSNISIPGNVAKVFIHTLNVREPPWPHCL